MSARIRITKVTDGVEIAQQMAPHMEALGEAVAARARRLVPKRTWALHDTIEAETVRSGTKITTTVSAGGGKVDYALHVERGTSKMRAQPYLRPAFAQISAADLDGGTSRSRRRARG